MVLFEHVSFEDPTGNPSGNVCQVIRHNFATQARGCIEDIKLRVINRERERERPDEIIQNKVRETFDSKKNLWSIFTLTGQEKWMSQQQGFIKSSKVGEMTEKDMTVKPRQRFKNSSLGDKY